MNTRNSRVKPKVKDDTPIQDELTPNKSSSKKALFTPFRRLGLSRKKAKQFSPVYPEVKYENSTTPIHTVAQANYDSPSTSQATVSPSTPIEVKPKSSASRRKKSSHPLKRTIDDTDKSEGNTYTVIVSPIPKKRKLEIIDIFNNESNPPNSPTIIDNNVLNDHLNYNINDNIKNSESNIIPHDESQLKVSSLNTKPTVKVSLPLEISQKLLNSPTKTTENENNDLSDNILKSDQNAPVQHNENEAEIYSNLKQCGPAENLMNEVSPKMPTLEIKPKKKRKLRDKSILTKEILNVEKDNASTISETNHINSEIKLSSKVSEEEPIIGIQEIITKQNMKKTRNTKSKTKSISAKIKNKMSDSHNTSKDVNEIIDDFDDDFRESTPTNKKKISIKNKKVIEPKSIVQKSKVKKVNLNTSNKQIDDVSKKNTRRKLNKNIENLEGNELVAEINNIDKNVDNTLTDRESKQITTNEKTNKIDKTCLEITNASSNLNTRVSNDTVEEISVLCETTQKTQLNISENEIDTSEGTIFDKKEIELEDSPSKEIEKCTGNLILPSENNEGKSQKNKAEKKYYGNLDVSTVKTDIKCAPAKSKDANLPPKLSQRQLPKNESKSKMDDDQLSYNDDSCDSSHYSTPVYSPVEEAARLAEDKDLIIQRCNVVQLSPSKKDDIIYECRVKNSQSPEKSEPISINKDSVGTLVTPFKDEQLNTELNSTNIKEKVCKISEKLKNDDVIIESLESQPSFDQNNDNNELKNERVPFLPNNLPENTEDDDFVIKKKVFSRKNLPNSTKIPKKLKNTKAYDSNTEDASVLKLPNEAQVSKKELRSSKKNTVDNKTIFPTRGEISIIDKLERKQETEKSSICLLTPEKTELLNYYPRVLINSNDIKKYYKSLEIKRQIADEKIYRVNKTPTNNSKSPVGKKSLGANSRKRKRRNSEVPKIPDEKSFESHVQEKNFIISRLDNYSNNEATEKLKYKNNEKDINKHTESVFFTPPSSRSENDSDSNRNDFHIETELLLINNPFGEGTSRQGLPTTPEIIETRTKISTVINTPTSQDEITPEDREVASISSKSSSRKREKSKQKQKIISKSTSLPSATSNVATDNFGFDYDSDDDFQTPRSQPKQIPSKNYIVKNESGVKCILKNEPCNRLERFRLTENSSVTAVHRGQCIEYIKSHDNYRKPKTDNYSNKSMIQIRCSSSPNRQPISSIFDSVVDDPVGYVDSQKTPPPRSLTNPLKREVQEQLKKEIKEVQDRIKVKQAKFERLNLINIYKKKHNFENLSKATLQMTKGAQEALLELAAVLRQRSDKPFDMGTLLDNMNIPHHIVRYNMDLDEFT